MNSEYWKKYLQRREDAEEAAEEVTTEEVAEDVVEEVETQEEVRIEPVTEVAPVPNEEKEEAECKCGQMRNNGQEVCNEHGQWVKFH